MKGIMWIGILLLVGYLAMHEDHPKGSPVSGIQEVFNNLEENINTRAEAEKAERAKALAVDPYAGTSLSREYQERWQYYRDLYDAEMQGQVPKEYLNYLEKLGTDVPR